MRIISLTGALGYGFSEEALNRALEKGVDLIGCDGGSSDPGPHYLGSGQVGFTHGSLKRDLDIGISAALKHKVPFVVGSAGLAGGQPHLEFIKDIVLEIAEEKGFEFTLALIHTELDKKYLKGKLRSGKVRPFSDQIELTEDSIDNSARIVAQIGTEPFDKALASGADVIIAGRACDTAIFATLPIAKGYPRGLAFHMAKIIECGAHCAQPAALDVVVADIHEDRFVLEPGSIDRKCTVARVAEHTLYEQDTPIYLIDPEGVTDISESDYEQTTDRSVSVRNSKFTEAATKTVKIEGAICVGYRTICMGGSNEPLFVEKLGEIIADTKRHVASNLQGGISTDDYTLNVRVYGGTKSEAEHSDLAAANVGVIIDVVGATQAIADFVLATARGRMMHFNYEGRKSTAGNLAFPYSPSDHPLGAVYEFSAYHVIEVDDFSEAYQIEYQTVTGRSYDTAS